MPPTPITVASIDDPRVEIFRDVRDKDLRGREHLFMAESEMVLRRLLRTPERLHALLITPKKFEQLRDELSVFDGPAYLAEIDLMTRIAGFHIHRGVLAAGLRPRPNELTLDHALGRLRDHRSFRLLVAEALTNVDNIGGLFRNAAAFGIDGIVLDPRCCDPLYRKAIRVSMGHALSIPYAACQRWPDDLVRLKDEWGVTLIGAEATPGAKPLWQMPRAERLAIVLGSEADGVSPEALELCDVVCEIPMAMRVPSINVAAAAAVFLYEVVRGER